MGWLVFGLGKLDSTSSILFMQDANNLFHAGLCHKLMIALQCSPPTAQITSSNYRVAIAGKTGFHVRYKGMVLLVIDIIFIVVSIQLDFIMKSWLDFQSKFKKKKSFIFLTLVDYSFVEVILMYTLFQQLTCKCEISYDMIWLHFCLSLFLHGIGQLH